MIFEAVEVKKLNDFLLEIKAEKRIFAHESLVISYNLELYFPDFEIETRSPVSGLAVLGNFYWSGYDMAISKHINIMTQFKFLNESGIMMKINQPKAAKPKASYIYKCSYEETIVTIEEESVKLTKLQ